MLQGESVTTSIICILLQYLLISLYFLFSVYFFMAFLIFISFLFSFIFFVFSIFSSTAYHPSQYTITSKINKWNLKRLS